MQDNNFGFYSIRQFLKWITNFTPLYDAGHGPGRFALLVLLDLFVDVLTELLKVVTALDQEDTLALVPAGRLADPHVPV